MSESYNIFLIPSYLTGRSEGGNLYCGISFMTVEIAPHPANEVVVRYRVHYQSASEIANPVDGFTRVKDYRVREGIRYAGDFAFKTPRTLFTVDKVGELCKDDFINHLRSKSLKGNYGKVFAAVFSRQLRGKYWRLIPNDPDAFKPTIFTAKYELEYRYNTTSKILEQTQGRVICLLENDQLFEGVTTNKIVYELPQVVDDSWLRNAAERIVAPNTLSRISPGFRKLSPAQRIKP